MLPRLNSNFVTGIIEKPLRQGLKPLQVCREHASVALSIQTPLALAGICCPSVVLIMEVSRCAHVSGGATEAVTLLGFLCRWCSPKARPSR